jgi:predicted nucleotidyltransferase
MANVLQSFDNKKTLNPDIWLNAENDDFMIIKLHPDVRKHLLSIANLFMETIKLKNVDVEDIIFTGSLANYNWSEYSDVDLHIVINKQSINIDPDTLDDYLTVKKDLFNSKHDIKIKGFDVELYAQGEDEILAALGIYSVLHNQWEKKPSKTYVAIDKARIKTKVRDFVDQIKKIDVMIQNEDNPQDVVAMIQTLKDKIKKYRKSGLASGGEYSDENLVFKYLRRTNYLQKLTDYKLQTIDRMFSLQELD